MKIINAMFLLFFSLSVPSNAATVYGGTASCGKVTSEAGDYMTGAPHMTYTIGLISGLNYALDVTWNKGPDSEGIWEAVRLYCKNNPLNTHRDAVFAVYFDIVAQQVEVDIVPNKKPSLR